MTAGNGLPCKKCGTSEWYKSGNCKRCQIGRYCTHEEKQKQKSYRESEQGKATRRAYQQTLEYKEKTKERNRTIHSKKLRREALRRYRANPDNHIKGKARQAVRIEVRAKRLDSPKDCECVNKCGRKGEQYHHHNGYDEGSWLDVVPVCVSCHAKMEVLA